MINQIAPEEYRQKSEELFAAGSDDKMTGDVALPGGDGVALPVDDQQSGDGVLAVEDWRELARRIETETDSKVMLDLIQQLIAKLDAESTGKKSPSRDE